VKLPRGVSADRLVHVMEQLGYRKVRQKGSHARLRHDGPPTHSITIPLHDQLKIGTLHGILTEVAGMRAIAIESIVSLP
jgi:predicted RNA binding protein YcfA (HicA-like mRNA interferase family)